MDNIFSYTMQNMIDARDPNFIHHDKYTMELKEPSIKYAYANTIVLEVKSSHYDNPEYQNKGYGKKYLVFILLEDFYTIAKDKDIDFYEAVEYALRYGDVHVRCDCKAFKYWGYAYISTQLRYIYGLPRENRSPNIRNPSMKGTICKHCDKAITFCLQNIGLVKSMFETYYERIRDGGKLIAIDSTGQAVNVGTKNGKGDVFYENEVKEQEQLDAIDDYEEKNRLRTPEEEDDLIEDVPETEEE